MRTANPCQPALVAHLEVNRRSAPTECGGDAVGRLIVCVEIVGRACAEGTWEVHEVDGRQRDGECAGRVARTAGEDNQGARPRCNEPEKQVLEAPCGRIAVRVAERIRSASVAEECCR